jgi:hypothetical protein
MTITAHDPYGPDEDPVKPPWPLEAFNYLYMVLFSPGWAEVA